MNSDSGGIVRSYLILTGLYTFAATLIWGVNTLFLLDAGLSISQVFFANAFYTAAMAIFEIPTGVLADTRGRRVSFLIGVVVLFLGTLGYVGAAQVGGGLLMFAIMSVILGLGFTFFSGAMEAWLVDALHATKFNGVLDDIFARGAIISSIAMLMGTILGGFLGTINLAIPFILRCAMLLVVFAVAFFTMKEIGFTPVKSGLSDLPEAMGKIAEASVKYGWQQPSMRLIIMTTFVQGLFYAWGFYAWQPYFLDLLGQDAPWVAGIVAAVIALAMMAGNYLVKWRANLPGRRTTLLLIASVLITFSTVAVGLTNSFYLAVFFYLISSLAMGIWKPVKQGYMHQLIPSEQRATVVSFDSLVDSAGSVIGQTGLGQLSENRSLAVGYMVGGALTALAWPVLFRLRRRNDPEDKIIGQAGKESACGAQGLPCISGLDSNAGVTYGGD